MTLKFRLLSTVMMFTFLAAVIAPAGAFAHTNVTIKRNSAFSHNKVDIRKSQRTHVRQSNRTFVLNGVLVGQNTGGNSANWNTGGTTDVDSGKATATVTNNTTTFDNVANVDLCGCEQDQNTNVTIKRNGAFSHNRVRVRSYKRTSVKQSNATAVVNLVGVGQNTGGNSANWNTGGGDVDVNSGDATATVTNVTSTGGNYLNSPL